MKHKSYILSCNTIFYSIKHALGPKHSQGEGNAQGMGSRGRNHGGNQRAHHPESVREKKGLLSDILYLICLLDIPMEMSK